MKIHIRRLVVAIQQDFAARRFDGSPSRSVQSRFRQNESLAMRGAAKIESFARVAALIANGKCSADDRLRFQGFQFRFDARLSGQHAGQIFFQRQFARDVFADRTNLDRLRIADCGLRIGCVENYRMRCISFFTAEAQRFVYKSSVKFRKEEYFCTASAFFAPLR